MADCIERPAVEWFWHAGHHDSVYVLSDDCGTYAAMVAERKTIRNGTPQAQDILVMADCCCNPVCYTSSFSIDQRIYARSTAALWS